MTLDHRTIRTGFGRFATGVTVVTCRNDDGEPHGAAGTGARDRERDSRGRFEVVADSAHLLTAERPGVVNTMIAGHLTRSVHA